MPIIGTSDAFSGLTVKSKWHSIKDIKSLANEVYKISKNLNLINELKQSSVEIGDLFLKDSELQLNELVSNIKKEIKSKKIKQKYEEKKVSNLKNIVNDRKIDFKLDETANYNSITYLTDTVNAYDTKLSLIIKQRNSLLEKNKKLKEIINRLKNKKTIFSHADNNYKKERIKILEKNLNKRTKNNLMLKKEIQHLKDQLFKRAEVNKNLRKLIDKYLK